MRILPDAIAVQLTYWLVTRSESLRQPEVSAVVDAIRAVAEERRAELLGEGSVS